MTRAGEEALAKRIWLDPNVLPSQLPEWISPDSGHDLVNNRGKYIAETCGDVMMCLCQLSQPTCFPIVCHQNASLVKAVSVANQLGDSWVIVT